MASLFQSGAWRPPLQPSSSNLLLAPPSPAKLLHPATGGPLSLPAPPAPHRAIKARLISEVEWPLNSPYPLLRLCFTEPNAWTADGAGGATAGTFFGPQEPLERPILVLLPSLSPRSPCKDRSLCLTHLFEPQEPLQGLILVLLPPAACCSS